MKKDEVFPDINQIVFFKKLYNFWNWLLFPSWITTRSLLLRNSKRIKVSSEKNTNYWSVLITPHGDLKYFFDLPSFIEFCYYFLYFYIFYLASHLFHSFYVNVLLDFWLYVLCIFHLTRFSAQKFRTVYK